MIEKIHLQMERVLQVTLAISKTVIKEQEMIQVKHLWPPTMEPFIFFQQIHRIESLKH